jgi:tripartite-type tricarboxylate transporter receptor subunit TctC
MIARRRLGALALAAAAVGTTAGARGQTGPPIRFIVGFAPGGTSDVTARVVGEALAASLGQTVLVENRPGAQGGIAIDAVVRSRPDGATVLISPPEVLYMPALDAGTPLDIEKSLAPVTLLSSQSIVIAANPGTGWKSIDDMMAAGRQNPDGITYATPGPGGTNNIIAAMMFRRAGVKSLNIPYKGGGQAVQDLLSGVVPVGILGSAPLMPHVKAGRVTLLAVTSRKRSALIPGVPALAELGFPDIDMSQWFAAFTAAATPAAIVDRLSAGFQKVLADRDVKAKLALAALEPLGGTPQDLSRRLKDEGETWLAVARKHGIGRS